jgi:hypothetical protein
VALVPLDLPSPAATLARWAAFAAIRAARSWSNSCHAAADGDVSPPLLRAVIGATGWDAEAGADAAQRFRPL